jgi:NosR/NirI family nitrous oxide reductase transcriptional regulator
MGAAIEAAPLRHRLRVWSTAAAVLLGAVVVVSGQPAAVDPAVRAQLVKLFPSATGFSPRSGEPPHFKAYVNDPLTGAQTVAGLAFWTTELEPLERGYDGPIKILVGMDLKGVLAGIVVAEHHEPYGNFSIDLPAFPAQFRGKSIRDGFRVGADVDAVSRATITVSSAARAVRNSARRVARQLLTPPAAR